MSLFLKDVLYSVLFLKLIFVYVEMDNEDYGIQVSEYFGVSGDAPKVSFPTIYLALESQ